MRESNRKSIALSCMILGLILLINSFFAIRGFAATTGATITISGVFGSNGDSTRIENTIKKINEKLIAESLVPDKGEGLILDMKKSSDSLDISINNEVYSKLKQVDKQEFISICLNEIQNSSISSINKTKIYNFIVDSDPSIAGLVRQLSEDISVDMPSAYAMFKPFSGPLGILLGLITIAIFAFLGITMVVDIAYITIPAIQLFLSRPSSKGDRPKLISLEAFDAVKIAEDQHVNGLGIYFRKKTGQIMILSICILYLVSGNIFALVAKVVDYFQGIVDLIIN